MYTLLRILFFFSAWTMEMSSVFGQSTCLNIKQAMLCNIDTLSFDSISIFTFCKGKIRYKVMSFKSINCKSEEKLRIGKKYNLVLKETEFPNLPRKGYMGVVSENGVILENSEKLFECRCLCGNGYRKQPQEE